MSQSVDVHADWLRLVEPEGQFVTLPVLHRAFSGGLDAIKTTVRDDLRKRYPRGATPTQDQWDAWVEWLFRSVLEWGPYYRTGDAVTGYTHAVTEHGVVLRADGALIKDDVARVLVMRYPHGSALDRRIAGERWNTSPIDRLKTLCKAQDVRLGIVTDGERIVLAWIPSVGPGGYATWDTSLFIESRERGLLQSFTSLLRASRFFAVQEDVQIEALFRDSEKAQNEVTSQLGFQIRQAVELLVNAISRANLERGGRLLVGISPQRVYEASVTVMMRLVFLLYAEERDLLPLSEPLYADFYAASTLREQLDEQAAMEGDEPLERRGAAWNRLLATFRVIYAGLNHDRLRLPPYGGRLFDPDRFPFLEGRDDSQVWNDTASHPLPIDDLTVRAILEAIQTLPIRENGSKERRRLSFRSLDVEQIGHVYEGLLDHGAERVNDVYVGLVGKTGDEAEIPLVDIEAAAKKGRRQVVDFLVEKTNRSNGAIEKLLVLGRDLLKGTDPETRRLLNTACDNDTALAARLAPFAYVLRVDLHGLPVIFKPGTLVVKQTRARRDSGTEYTPRELAEEMVLYALEPLVYSPGPRDGVEPKIENLRSSEALLDLKICDPAVGSGAFLVSACRYLADRVVEAWVSEDPQRGSANRDDLTLEARRAVVDRCLYGVDRDAMAVEMAKLSLWLITMARERSFSFLDHTVREGDSLLGITSIEQVLNAHIDPKAGKALHDQSLFDVTAPLKTLVNRAAHIRGDLEALPSATVRDSELKQRLNDEANSLLSVVLIVADSVVATALDTANLSDDRKAVAFRSLAINVQRRLELFEEGTSGEVVFDDLRVSNEQKLNAGRPSSTPVRIPLHWPLAFPEVFSGRHGFDALIGNPPFIGGQKISAACGADYRSYLLSYIAAGRRGSADLVSYFFLKGTQIATSLSLLATSTISEGDTREVGLDAILDGAWRIFRAVRNRPWPGTAGVYISQVWLMSGDSSQSPILDGTPVPAISSRLHSLDASSVGNPFRLEANAKLAFQGSNMLGLGFTMAPSEAAALIKKNRINKDVVRPYVNAEDLCSRPDAGPSRWAIYFRDWPLEKAEKYPDCMRIVRSLVKPERDLNRDKSRRQYWWRFTRPTVDLYAAIETFDEVIVMPLVSKAVVPLMCSTDMIFSHKLAVIATDDLCVFGILSSTVHRSWARKYSSSRATGTNYSPTDCLETFPLIIGDAKVSNVARHLNSSRASLMEGFQIGLTTLYNRVHDPVEDDKHIVDIRELHKKLDIAVCAAYGWHDLSLQYGFHVTDEGVRWSMDGDSQAKILERLLNLNHQRHAEEEALAANMKSDRAKKKQNTKNTKKSTKLGNTQMALY